MRMKRIAFLVIALLSFTLGCNAQEYVDDVGSAGAQNAVKKAHQMTDLEFVPLQKFYANPKKTYQKNKKSKGLIYSEVQEPNTFVGIDVSFHTFMTAMHNPRSVLYTEDISRLPYHGGKSSGAYYGTVCSGFVSYALGLDVYMITYDIPNAGSMLLVEDQSAKGLQLADVLWQKGHVALVTGIRRNKETGEIVRIEISEAWKSGCRRRVKNSEDDFNAMLREGKWKIYRYKDLDKNTYTPWPEFVAVEGEEPVDFQYNDAICPNRGDKSCYITGDTVVLNIAKGYGRLEIYKDDEHYHTIKLDDDLDIVLRDLPYGDYKARLKKWPRKSEFTYWKVVDVHVTADKDNQLVLFHSDNARPVYLEFCYLKGTRPEWGIQVLSDKDISSGYVKVGSLQKKRLSQPKYTMYVKVHFECDYGRVINRPILWEKSKNSNNSLSDDSLDDTTG